MAKAKDGSECFTRQNKSGGKYVTCEGTQKARKSASKAKSAAKPKQKKPKQKNLIGHRPAAAGRIDTGGPRNVGKVVTEKPKFKDSKPKEKKSMSEGEKVLAALHPWQRNKGILNAIKNYEEPESRSDPVLSEDAVKKFNKLNNIPKNPKKYLVADIQGRKPFRYVGAQNTLISIIDKENREKSNIKVTFHQFDTWQKALQYIDVLKKVDAKEKKKYEPLSKTQKERISKMTAKNGVALTPQNNQSFKYGFGFVGVSPWGYSGSNPPRVLIGTDSPGFSDINYKKKK